MTFEEFKKDYGTHKKCLKVIKEMKYPDGKRCKKCRRKSIFYQVKGRTSFACKWCGFHVYPLKGTIFEASSTPLDKWFLAMYLMISTRAGISSGQLHRMLGVTPKTAFRIGHKIRELMKEEPDGLIEGIVEVDETFVGGKGRHRAFEWRANKKKEVVMGFVVRGKGAYLKHVQSTKKHVLFEEMKANVSPHAWVMTDDNMSYRHLLTKGFYHHHSVNHSEREYVRGKYHTQNVENMWSHMKRGINGTYRVVSPKYLQKYSDEFAFRYSHRKEYKEMLRVLILRIDRKS